MKTWSRVCSMYSKTARCSSLSSMLIGRRSGSSRRRSASKSVSRHVGARSGHAARRQRCVDLSTVSAHAAAARAPRRRPPPGAARRRRPAPGPPGPGRRAGPAPTCGPSRRTTRPAAARAARASRCRARPCPPRRPRRRRSGRPRHPGRAAVPGGDRGEQRRAGQQPDEQEDDVDDGAARGVAHRPPDGVGGEEGPPQGRREQERGERLDQVAHGGVVDDTPVHSRTPVLSSLRGCTAARMSCDGRRRPHQRGDHEPEQHVGADVRRHQEPVVLVQRTRGRDDERHVARAAATERRTGHGRRPGAGARRRPRRSQRAARRPSARTGRCSTASASPTHRARAAAGRRSGAPPGSGRWSCSARSGRPGSRSARAPRRSRTPRPSRRARRR